MNKILTIDNNAKTILFPPLLFFLRPSPSPSLKFSRLLILLLWHLEISNFPFRTSLEQGLEAQLVSLAAAASVVACDSAEVCDVGVLLSAIPTAGVLHAAGVLRDSMFRSMSAMAVHAV